MLEIRYSEDEVELAASKREFEGLRTALSDFISGDLREMQLQADTTITSEPWNCVARELKILRRGGGVRVSVGDGSTLVVEGSDQNLDNFASFLFFDTTAESGEHSHFEFHDGNNYITPDSIPLIIRVQ